MWTAAFEVSPSAVSGPQDARLLIDVRDGSGVPQCVSVVGYSLTVAGDAAHDPSAWAIEGRAGKDSPWVLLDQRRQQRFHTRWQCREFHVRVRQLCVSAGCVGLRRCAVRNVPFPSFSVVVLARYW